MQKFRPKNKKKKENPESSETENRKMLIFITFLPAFIWWYEANNFAINRNVML